MAVVDLSNLLPNNRKTLNPFGAVAGNREAPAPAMPASSVPYAPTQHRTPDDVQARIDALSAQNQPKGLPSFTVPDQYSDLNPVKAAIPQAPVQSPTTVPSPYSQDVYGQRAQTTFVQPSEPARNSGIKTAKERAKYSILQAYLNDPRQDQQSKQAISDALQSGTSPDEFVTALRSNGYVPQVDENSLAEAEQISKSMFKDEGEAFKRLVNEGMSVDDAHSTINQRWNEALGQTTEEENAQLEKLREDGVSAASAIKNIQKRRIDEKWANEHPFKNFAEGVLDVGAGAASLAMEQVGNVAGFLGSDYGQQFAQETKEATAESGLAGGTGYQAGRNVLGLGESVAAAPASWATEAGMAKTLAGRAGQGAVIGAYQGAAEPILEKGNEVTAEEIATGGAMGAGIGAVAVPVFEKGIQYAETALSKGVREAGKELAGDVTGMFKKTPEVPVVGETAVEGAATPSEMAAVEKVEGKTVKAVFNEKEVEIPQPKTGIGEFLTSPFREKDTKVLAGRAIAPRSVGVNKNPKQKAKLLANTEKDATEFHAQIRSGELTGEIETLEDTAQTIMKNLDEVGDKIGKAIDGLGDNVPPKSSGLLDDTLSKIDDVLADEIQSDAAAFSVLQKFRQRVDQAKTWKQVQAVKKNYQAELNKLLRNNEAGTEAYAALQKGVQDLTKSIEDAVSLHLPDAQYGKLKSQYALLKRLAGDVAQSALVESRRAPQTLVEQLSYLDALTNPLSFAKQQLVKEVAELNTRGGSWKELVKILDKRGVERAKNFKPAVVPETPAKPVKTEISPVSGAKKPPEEPPTPPKGGEGGQKVPKVPGKPTAPVVSIAKEIEKAGGPKVPQKPASKQSQKAKKAAEIIQGKPRNEKASGSAPKVQEIFAGEKAKNPPKTGWTEGADGKMRFEIDDSVAKILSEVELTKNGHAAYLKNVLSHDELFEQYPELKDTSVFFSKYERPGNANYDPETGAISVSYEEFINPKTGKIWGAGSSGTHDTLKSKILHEIQHAIQEKEGFARGTTSNAAFRDPRMFPMGKEDLAANDEAWKLYNEKVKELSTPMSIEEYAKQGWQTSKITKEIQEAYGEYVKSLKTSKQKEIIQKGAEDYASKEWYKRHAGEVEARNVQKRMDMSKEERASKSPESTEDRPRSKQIVRFSSEKSQSVADELSDLKTFPASRAELMAEKQGVRLGDVNKALVERGYVLKSGLGGDNWVKTETAGKFKGKEGIFAGIRAKNAPKSDYTGWTKESGGKLQFEIDDSTATTLGLKKSESKDFFQMVRDSFEMSELANSTRGGIFKTARDANRYAKLETSVGQAMMKTTADGRTFEDVLSDLFSGNKTLGDVLDHPELYRQYPELKDMKFFLNEMVSKDGTKVHSTKGAAFYSSGDDEWPEAIAVNLKTILKEYEDARHYEGANAFERFKMSLIHEIQHAVQKREGFASGASPSTALEAKDEAVAETLKKARGLFVKLRELNEAQESPGVQAIMDKRGELEWDAMAETDVAKKEAKIKELEAFMEKNADVIKKYRETAEEIRNTRNELLKANKRAAVLDKLDQYDAYYYHGGEVQSRNAEKRMKMSMKERLANSPESTESVPREFQISKKAEGSMESITLPGKEEKKKPGLSGLKKPSVMSSELKNEDVASKAKAEYEKYVSSLKNGTYHKAYPPAPSDSGMSPREYSLLKDGIFPVWRGGGINEAGRKNFFAGHSDGAIGYAKFSDSDLHAGIVHAKNPIYVTPEMEKKYGVGEKGRPNYENLMKMFDDLEKRGYDFVVRDSTSIGGNKGYEMKEYVPLKGAKFTKLKTWTPEQFENSDIIGNMSEEKYVSTVLIPESSKTTPQTMSSELPSESKNLVEDAKRELKRLGRDASFMDLPDSQFKEQFGISKSESAKMILKNRPSAFRPEGRQSLYEGSTDMTARERFDISVLEKIGSGSDRDVYQLPDGNVLKIAKTARGLGQNSIAGDYVLDGTVIPHAIEFGDNYVVFEKVTTYKNATPAEKKTLNEFIDDMQKVSGMVDKRGNYDWNAVNDILEKYGWEDLHNYSLHKFGWADVRKANVGIKDGHPILLDEGTVNLVDTIAQYNGVKNLQDPEFRDVYGRSKDAKKKFGDTDKNTMYSVQDKKGLSGLRISSSELPPASPAQELSDAFKKAKDVVKFYQSKDFRKFEQMADEMVQSLPGNTGDMTPEQVKTFRQWNALKNKIRDVYSAVGEQSAKDRSYARDLRADGTEGDLVALHNLGIDKIKKIRELGGLPGPSIGITKKSIPFEDFGDITLVGNRELVESLDAATYDADIYSPRVPSHTLVDKPQYRTNEARKALEERLAKAEKKYPWRKTSVWNVVEGARESDTRNLDAQLLFASENGIKVEPVRSIPEGPSFFNKAVITKNVPIEKLAKYLPAKAPEDNEEFTNLMLDISKKIIRENGLEDNVLNDKKYDKFGFGDADRMYSYLKSLKRVIEEGVPVDVHDTTRNIRDVISQKGLSEKFERFYSEIADEFFDKKLFKGFTYSGGKKFEDYTMDNIIREMFKSGAKGTESGQFSGNLSQTLGKNAKKLGLEGIRKMKFAKLDSEYSKLRERWNSIVGWNNKEAIDVEFNPSKSAEWNADRIGNGFSEEDAQELLDIYKEARKLPRSYIETKFKRAVKLSEFKAVIAPKDKVKELKELLKGTGLEDRIVSYDPATEKRNSKLDSVRKKFGSIFFSQGGALIPAAYVMNEAMKQNGQGEGR